MFEHSRSVSDELVTEAVTSLRHATTRVAATSSSKPNLWPIKITDRRMNPAFGRRVAASPCYWILPMANRRPDRAVGRHDLL